MNVDVGVRRRFSCSPEQVFAVLRDGWIYPVWVVGASRMRDVDDGWPAPGTKLHHSFGMWLLLLDGPAQLVPSRYGWPGSTYSTARRCAGSPTWPKAARKQPSSTRDSLVVR